MIKISGYEVNNCLYKGSRSKVYRARRLVDSLSVVLKVHADEFPRQSEMLRFRREFKIGQRFQNPNIIEYHALEAYHHCLAIVVEDFGAVGLLESIPESGFSLKRFLSIAIQLVDALSAVHQLGVIHKDVKPANMLIHPSNGVVKLIDFGLSCSQSDDDVGPDLVEGTVAYLSPEQTGRMNRKIDFRSDFYSLGVTFYQLLSGHLPFEVSDVSEMIHCHIAKQALPLDELNPVIPKTFSALVNKLMAKGAEERYQTDAGLKADLERLRDLLAHDGSLKAFPLGERDLLGRFQLSQKLFGRGEDLKQLLAVVDRVERGACEFALVLGKPGLGKSKLIGEVQKSIVDKRGYFITGKCTSACREQPFGVLMLALRDLFRQILVEQEDRVRTWKAAILEIVGGHGAVLMEAIPELEGVIGPQPQPMELSFQGAQNRLQFALKNLLVAATNCQVPLALLLDDLHLADEASLKLLHQLLAERHASRFVWFGTWGADQLDKDHAFSSFVTQMKRHRVPVSQIVLKTLSQSDISALIAETLHTTVVQVAPLADLVGHKTDGNPHFVCEFLKTLAREGLLVFDGSSSRWTWDLKDIDALEVTPNVVELLVEQIQAMPESTQVCLSEAAVLGFQFDLKTLAFAIQENPEVLVNSLWPALEIGLLVSQGPVDLNKEEQSLFFKYSHEQVQQVAYSLIEEEKRNLIHLRLGRYLLAQKALGSGEHLIYKAVTHLNQARHLISDPQELFYLIRHDIIAAKRAIASSSYETALQHLEKAMAFLPEGSWTRDYATVFDLYLTRAQCAWYCSLNDEAETLYTTLLAHARPDLDKVQTYTAIVVFYTHIHRLEKAIEIAIEALHSMDLMFPLHPSPGRLKWEALRLRFLMGKRQPEDLVDLEQLTQPNRIACLNLLMSMGAALYQMGNLKLYALVCMTMTRLSLGWGNCAISAYGYAAYGMILSVLEGDYQNGYAFGKLAMVLIGKYQQQQDLKCRIYFLFGVFISHWHRPFHESDVIFEEGYRAGMESGNLAYASLCVFNRVATGVTTGRFLMELGDEVSHMEFFLRQSGTAFRLPMLMITRKLVEGLQSATSPSTWDEKGPCGEELLANMLEQPYHTGVAWFYGARLFLLFFRGQYEAALVTAELFHTYSQAMTGTSLVPDVLLYEALARAAIYTKINDEQRLIYCEQIKKAMDQMAKHASYCPENYKHRYLLLRAEWMRINGEDASKLLDEAIELASENGFPHHVALANELAGRFWLAQGRKKIGDVYLISAFSGYRLWGATCKLEALREEFKDLVETVRPDSLANHSYVEDSSLVSRQLDLQAITKAFLAISSELDYQKLVGLMLTIMVENAGAERGFLVLTASGKPTIEAALDDGQLVSLPDTTIQASQLSEAILRYVIRTGQLVVLADAAVDDMFSKDEYILKNKPQSILCLPLRQKERVAGVLYLENNLTANAFSQDRVSTLEILLAQASLCLEHSRLYMETISLNNALKNEVEERKLAEEAVRHLNVDLEQRVKERTAQLERSQKELVERAHRAGMADIATSVLHNVGNILSSVTTSSQLIRSTVEARTLTALKRANNLLRDNFDTVEEFILKNPKGKKLLLYYLELEKLFDRDYQKISEHLDSLMVKIDSIREVIMAQQSFASTGFQSEQQQLSKVVEDAISILDNSMGRHEITLERYYQAVPPLMLQKTKMVHIVINLLKNAKEAMLSLPVGEKKIQVTVDRDEGWAYVRIADTGCGIPPDLIEKIFSHGFTTKKNGHGFGLHSCANAMTEMGGSLYAESDGVGKGATFIVELPLKPYGG